MNRVEGAMERAKRVWGRVRRRVERRRAQVPFDGWPPSPTPVPLVDRLDDESLHALNALLPWHCFTVDGRGRRLGDAAWVAKRMEPQVIPDRRVTLLDERIGLAGRHVLELGCFEGVHTIALSRAAARVTAVDARVENVAKTIVRCGLYGVSPTVTVADVDGPLGAVVPGPADVLFHVGVLYHLKRPVEHVLSLGEVVSDAVLLDTHVADTATDGAIEFGGRSWPYRRWIEETTDPFAGTSDHAKWLLLDDLVELLALAGFRRTDVIEHRSERNGPRVLLLAER